jgi:uncharacterized membrane protein
MTDARTELIEIFVKENGMNIMGAKLKVASMTIKDVELLVNARQSINEDRKFLEEVVDGKIFRKYDVSD